MVNEKSLKNLRSFTPGHKPYIVHRGPSLDAILRKLLTKKIKYEDPTTKIPVNGSIAQAIVLREVYNALEGDQRALEYIIDRIDGKIIQKLLGEGFEHKDIYYTIVKNYKKESENSIQLNRETNTGI